MRRNGGARCKSENDLAGMASRRTKSPRRAKTPPKSGPKRLIPKSELRKIKQMVSARRKAGEEGVDTDDEVQRAGWHLEVLRVADGPEEAHPSSGMALVVPHARQEDEWDCGLACAHMSLCALGVGAQDCSLAANVRLRSSL